ncbi:hypothetical protein D3C72_648130 [compost metagenome]
MGLDQASHVRIEQVCGQRGTGRPAHSDFDDRIEVFFHGLTDSVDMGPDVTLQRSVRQVLDPLVTCAQGEQSFARRFERVVAAQELPVVAVRQVQQSDAADLLFDEADAGQGHRAFAGGVLAADFQRHRQQHKTLAAGLPRLWGVGVDGDVQQRRFISAEVFLQACIFALYFQHQAPRLDQAFPAMLFDECRLAGGALEGVTDLLLIGFGQVQLRQNLAQIGQVDAVEQARPILFMRRGDFQTQEDQAL